MPAPGYPLYTAILNKLGAEEVSYNLDQANRWRPSPDEVRAAITDRTRAIILINPNNPTGAITPDETTRELLEIAARHNLLVISDEVYRELCFGPQPAPASLIAREMGAPRHHARQLVEDAPDTRLARGLDALHEFGADARVDSSHHAAGERVDSVRLRSRSTPFSPRWKATERFSTIS